MGQLLDSVVAAISPIRENISTTASSIPGVTRARSVLATSGVTLRPLQRLQTMMSTSTLGGHRLIDRLRSSGFKVTSRTGTSTLGIPSGPLGHNTGHLTGFNAIGYRR